MCKYCLLGIKLGIKLKDEEEISMRIGENGYLEVNVCLETNQYDDYYEEYIKEKAQFKTKINYCPICGRKL